MEVAKKKVLVFGMGISGIGAAGLLEEQGAEVTLYDGNEKLEEEKIRGKLGAGSKAQIVIGPFPEELLDTLDIVVLSPGVPTDLPSRYGNGGSCSRVRWSLPTSPEKETCWRSPVRMERRRPRRFSARS